MKKFLTYVAKDIINEYPDMSKVAVVFPNKRASLFLNEELMKEMGRPFWCPNYITISDLFRRHTQLQVADPIKLICDLHKTFVECTNVNESLDHFYGWGQLLLADFDDIDKNMGDVKQIFFNVENLHELDDDSYLTEEQRKILKKFFGNFNDGHNSELKKRFIELWSKLGDIYTAYNKRLAEQGLAYEGALYRQVAENTNIQFEYENYLFVGFNMMQKVEIKLFEQLKEKANCQFYWDFDKYYVNDGKSTSPAQTSHGHVRNEAGHYITEYLQKYGNKLANHQEYDEIYDNLSQPKEIAYISAPTENIQARYIHDWLLEKKHFEDGKWIPRYQAGRKTAIVLADENLLPTIIHSLPTEVENVNITLGYPLGQTPFFSLVQQLVQLQTYGRVKGTDTFRLKYVAKVLRHPYASYISENSCERLAQLEAKKRFYPTLSEICDEDDHGLNALFANFEAAEDFNLALLDYLVNILKLIGVSTKEKDNTPLFQESLFRTYTLVNRLRGLVHSGDLKVDIITLERLIQQLFQATSVPFHGEPAEGIQIMGVLETRNLDFEHVLLLSCNEGNLPKGVNDASFIPYSVRKANGLTTIDNKVSIFAYYFLSMIQRANDVTITYNNSTEDGHTGEMSRFMLQLLVESKQAIKRYSLVAGQTPVPSEAKPIEKSETTMSELNQIKMFTPTCLNTFIRCRKRFYYKYIKHIQEPDELNEEIDNRSFGNIFHRAAELFYLSIAPSSALVMTTNGELELKSTVNISKSMIEDHLKDERFLKDLVNRAFCEELFKVSDKDYHPSYNGLQLINREVIVGYLKQLLRNDIELAPFTIMGLEKKVTKKFKFDTPDGSKQLFLGGFIDRLDAVSHTDSPAGGNDSHRIRVIDYKTGKVVSSFPKNAESLFSSDEISKHSDYYLQAMLYSLIVKNDTQLNPHQYPVSPALLFIQQSSSKGYDPTLKFGKDKIWDAGTYEEEFMQGLRQLINDIFDKEQAFTPTDDKGRCSTCPYASLCL